MVQIEGAAQRGSSADSAQFDSARDGQLDYRAYLGSHDAVGDEERTRVDHVAPGAEVDRRSAHRLPPADAQLARGGEGGAGAAHCVDPSRSPLRVDLQRALGPRCGTERELVEPDGRDPVANLLARSPHPEPGRPGGRQLGGAAQPECRVAVRVTAAPHQGRDGGSGRHPRRRQLASYLGVRGMGAEPPRVGRDRGTSSARPHQGPRAPHYGVPLAGRQAQRIVVPAQRLTVAPGARQHVGHRHVPPWVRGLERDVTAE